MKTDLSLQWTPTNIQTLLQNPQRLLQHAQWQTAIQQFGGLSGFYQYLQNLRLSERQLNLLTVITAHPKASVIEYCERLHIHAATFHRHQRDLWQTLSLQLTSEMPLKQAQQAPPARLKPQKRSQLPHPLTPLIGRSQEIAFIHNILQQSVRLITLTGIGGIGKTRLAIQLAHELEAEADQKVYFCSFVDIREPEAALLFLARQLAIPYNPQTDDLIDLLAEYFSEQSTILILDNLEHMLSIAPMLSTLLRQTASLKIITTSRIRLNLYGEHVLPIQSLSVADPQTQLAISDIDNFDSLRLFVSRAQAINPFFQVNQYTIAAIQRICHKLDGIPLAIEFAAGHCNHLTAEAIVIGLNKRFELLTNSTNDAEARHQTLYATLDWSYQLLEPETKYIFNHLGIFQAPWNLELTYPLFPQFSHDYIEQQMHLLVEHQFLKRVSINNVSAYMMLETIRDYAQQQLSSLQHIAAVQELIINYVYHYLQINPHTDSNKEQWIDQIQFYYPHIIQSLHWLDNAAYDHRLAEIVYAIIPYWLKKSYNKDGLDWCKKIIDTNNGQADLIYAKTLYHFSVFHGSYWNYVSDDVYILATYLETSIKIIQKYPDELLFLAEVYNRLAVIQSINNKDIAFNYWRKSLAIYKKYPMYIDIGRVYNNIGNLFRMGDRFEKSIYVYQKSINAFRLANDTHKLPIALGNYASGLLAVNRIDEALEALNEALAHTKANSDLQGMTLNLMYLYEVLQSTKRLDAAETIVEQAKANIKILRTKYFDHWINRAETQLAELRQQGF
ncbi:tetratricopeptide repeat protein [Herpetosiphon llansteffanensis]|uniref:tetratricopeptide repeat protein n=1 Tax=Herpetosiphon llansteffanensis TaxID=2094568 RepID=UPI000D7BAF4B|nr:tetratricopeptide repeat protein [Herpetosiphon llansteffanensis]